MSGSTTKEPTALIQAHIPKSLAAQLRAELKERAISWNEYAETVARQFLAQTEKEKKP